MKKSKQWSFRMRFEPNVVSVWVYHTICSALICHSDTHTYTFIAITKSLLFLKHIYCFCYMCYHSIRVRTRISNVNTKSVLCIEKEGNLGLSSHTHAIRNSMARSIYLFVFNTCRVRNAYSEPFHFIFSWRHFYSSILSFIFVAVIRWK